MVQYERTLNSVIFKTDNNKLITVVSYTELIEFFITNRALEEVE